MSGTMPPAAGLQATNINATGMTLAWDQAQPPPLAYILQYKVHGTTVWHNAEALEQHVIMGLATNTAYDFQVVAVYPASSVTGMVTESTTGEASV